MRFYILFIAFLIFNIANGQKNHLDSLADATFNFYLRQINDSLKKESYDSFVVICHQIKSLNHKMAKERNINFYLAVFYYKAGNERKAIKLSKQFLRYPILERPCLKTFFRNIDRRELSYNLYNIYLQHQDYSKALKYLIKIENKYNNYWSCFGPNKFWKVDLYKKIIQCYSILHKTKKVEIYKRKLIEVER